MVAGGLTISVVLFMLVMLPNFFEEADFKTLAEYAQEYKLANFAGIDIDVDIDYGEQDRLDIYGTVKTIDEQTAELELVLAVPDYLIDSSLGARYGLLKNKFARTVNIWLEKDSNFFDPYNANLPVTFAEMTNSKDKRIFKVFTGSYVHIKAMVNDRSDLVVKDISIATIQ